MFNLEIMLSLIFLSFIGMFIFYGVTIIYDLFETTYLDLWDEPPTPFLNIVYRNLILFLAFIVYTSIVIYLIT